MNQNYSFAENPYAQMYMEMEKQYRDIAGQIGVNSQFAEKSPEAFIDF